MGATLSSNIVGSVCDDEVDIAARAERTYATHALFRRWTVDDVDYAMSQFTEMADVVGTQELDAKVLLPKLLRARVSWKEYYDLIFLSDEHRLEREIESRRRSWHPCTVGYSMEKDESASEAMRAYQLRKVEQHEPPKTETTAIDDWYTTDEESDDDDVGDDDDAIDEDETDTSIPLGEPDGSAAAGNSDGSRSKETDTQNKYDPVEDCDTLSSVVQQQADTRHEVPKSFNPTLCSPIFFGHHATRLDACMERKPLESSEARGDAIMQQKLRQKEEALRRFATESHLRKQKRDERIQSMRDRHDSARRRREEELHEIEKAELSPAEKENIMEQHRVDDAAAAAAAAVELAKLVKTHESRTKTDAEEKKSLEEDVQMWREMESKCFPAGAALEKAIGKELKRRTDELDQEMEALDEAKEKFDAVHEDLGDKKRLDSAQRSLLIFVESRVQEAERRTEKALHGIEDEEVLLGRARRRREKEDKILPLFRPLAPCSSSLKLLGEVGIVDLVASIVTVCGDNLVNKIRFLVALFDINKDEFLSRDEFVSFLSSVSRALHALGYLSHVFDVDAVQSICLRAFNEMEAGMIRGVTRYETRQWVRSIVSRNRCLAALLEVDWDHGERSTIQLFTMDPVRQYEQGILSISDLKYHLARNRIEHRPNLDPARKLSIHKLAMSMGADDPTKQDYSKFLPKRRKAVTRESVVPLEHGHLANYTVQAHQTAVAAAYRLQRIFRGRKSRRHAEEVARKQAFLSARETALEEMKQRVRADFENNENATGSSKMKWDASIRMQQAKLKAATGRILSRDEVIQHLITQAEEKGRHDVFSKFDEMAARTFNVNSVGDELADENTSAADCVPLHDSDSRRDNLISVFDAFRLSDPNPSGDMLLSRIRSCHDAMTLLKTKELLLELPSKRLLCRYITSWRDHSSLLQDLVEHFRIDARFVALISSRLLSVVKGDAEYGMVGEIISQLSVCSEPALTELSERRLARDIEAAKDRIGSASNQSKSLSIQESVYEARRQALSELSELEGKVQKLDSEFNKLSSVVTKEHRALEECKWNYECIIRYGESLEEGQSRRVPAAREVREDWMARFLAAMDRPEATENEALAKYVEIDSVAEDFIHVASCCARVIVEEFHLPAYMKTIRPVEIRPLDGRASEGGRGHQGKRHVYECRGIRFNLLVDHHGIFDGSDENAMKAGGHEIRSSREYIKCGISNMVVPLQAAVDVYGYRVLATAVLPIVSEAKRGGPTSRDIMVLGTSDRGSTVLNKDATLEKMMASCADKLNLSKHLVKGDNDITARQLPGCSVDIRGYRDRDGTFCLCNFWRAFPSENPMRTPHLSADSPRGMTIFWRMLRPEFVSNYHTPLSPDANCDITSGTADCNEHVEKNEEATQHLISGVLKTFCERLRMLIPNETSFGGLGIDITNEMHQAGLNMRHLGLARSYFLPSDITGDDMAPSVVADDNDASTIYIRSFLLAEMAARTFKNLYRHYLRYVSKAIKTASKSFQQSLLLDFLNRLVGVQDDSCHFWATHIFCGIRHRYGDCAIMASERMTFQSDCRPFTIYMVRRFVTMLGVTLTHDCLSSMAQQDGRLRFTSADILHLGMKVKHNIYFKELASAIKVSNQFKQVLSKNYKHGVKTDGPLLYFTLSERRGSNHARNYGSLADQVTGTYSGQEENECTGPLNLQPDNFSAFFSSSSSCWIDTNFCEFPVGDGTIQQNAFTVEIWAKVTGGKGQNRIAMMSNRCALVANRYERWSFVLFEGEGAIVSLDGPQIVMAEWTHLAGTYDGATSVLYINGKVWAHVDVSERKHTSEKQRQAASQEIDRLEQSLLKKCSKDVDKECNDYIETKEGQKFIRTRCKQVMREENYGTNDHTTKKEVEEEVIRRYRQDLYDAKVESVKYTIQQRREEVLEKQQIESEYAEDISRKSLCIGSTGKSMKSNSGRSFFEGYLCHAALYNRCLSADDISKHVRNANDNYRVAEASRYLDLADRQFKSAVTQDPDMSVVSHYLSHLYLSLDAIEVLEIDSKNEEGGRHRFLRAERILSEITVLRNAQGLAEALRRLPKMQGSAALVCKIFRNIIELDPNHFRVDSCFPLKELAFIPFRHSMLDEESTDDDIIGTISTIFCLVLSEESLSSIYGGVDLRWLRKLKNTQTVVSLVWSAHATLEEEVVDFTRFGCSAEIQDHDLISISRNMKKIRKLNIASCYDITDKALAEIVRNCKFLEHLVLDDCEGIQFDCLGALELITPHLSSFSAARCRHIQDEAVISIIERTRKMKSLVLSGCKNITNDTFVALAGLRKVESVNLSFCTALTDIGLKAFASTVDPSTLTSLDLSCCRSITDSGVGELGRLLFLRSLALKGIDKCSDVGLRKVLLGCKSLVRLDIEDLHLITDACFDFKDQERTVLVSLEELNIRDCSTLSDTGISRIAQQCETLQRLVASGVSLLTDGAVKSIAAESMSMHVVVLCLEGCTNITDNSLDTIAHHMHAIERIDLSGCLLITDDGIEQFKSFCVRTKAMLLARCKQLTDRALRSIASLKNIEEIDLSACNRITDDGVFAIASACSSLKALNISCCRKLSSHSFVTIAKKCRNLRVLQASVGRDSLGSERYDKLVALLPPKCKLVN